MFGVKCAAETLLTEKLREVESLLANRKAIADEQASLRITLTRVRRAFELLEEKLVRSESLLMEAQSIVEQATRGNIVSNDAQTHRYNELARRLDAYEKWFRQLGLLITTVQPPAPADFVPPSSADAPDRKPD